MALQWLDSENELRILLCIHGPQHLPSAINFIEISRGRDGPGIMVYVTDMIELTEQIESTLVHTEGEDMVIVTDSAILEMRNQITTAIKTYEEEYESGVTLPLTIQCHAPGYLLFFRGLACFPHCTAVSQVPSSRRANDWSQLQLQIGEQKGMYIFPFVYLSQKTTGKL